MKKFILTLFWVCMISCSLSFAASDTIGNNLTQGNKYLQLYEKAPEYELSSEYLKQAKHYFFQAEKSDPTSREAILGLAQVYLYQNNYPKTHTQLMKAMSMYPYDAYTNLYLAELYFKREQFTKAYDFYNYAYQYGLGGDFLLNYKLGLCSEKLALIDAARFYYQKALSIRPDSLEAKEKLQALTVY